jgi:hypothetical protein
VAVCCEEAVALAAWKCKHDACRPTRFSCAVNPMLTICYGCNALGRQGMSCACQHYVTIAENNERL